VWTQKITDIYPDKATGTPPLWPSRPGQWHVHKRQTSLPPAEKWLKPGVGVPVSASTLLLPR